MSESRIINAISREVVDAAITVHRHLGPGLLESAYHVCVAHELRLRGCAVATQLPLPIIYKGVRTELAYRLDMLVEGKVVVELKSVAKLHPLHEAQLLSYLKLGDYRLGLLMNFHERVLKDGIRRIVNDFLDDVT